MLLLSRREKETVHFPNLGISVEVVCIKGKAVRLGIDAPKKVRVVRGELEVFDLPDLNPVRFTDDESVEIRENLDAANLAVHLAQNQLRQGLPEHADEVLEQAIARIQKLETYLCGNRPAQTSSAVRETGTHYQVDRNRVAMSVSDEADNSNRHDCAGCAPCSTENRRSQQDRKVMRENRVIWFGDCCKLSTCQKPTYELTDEPVQVKSGILC